MSPPHSTRQPPARQGSCVRPGPHGGTNARTDAATCFRNLAGTTPAGFGARQYELRRSSAESFLLLSARVVGRVVHVAERDGAVEHRDQLGVVRPRHVLPEVLRVGECRARKVLLAQPAPDRTRNARARAARTHTEQRRENVSEGIKQSAGTAPIRRNITAHCAQACSNLTRSSAGSAWRFARSQTRLPSPAGRASDATSGAW